MKVSRLLGAAAAILAVLPVTIRAAATSESFPLERATMLSPFGERPAFSPDGTRLAFVGKSYGDAYEVEPATWHVRNLTGNVPYQGFLRIHYLANGEYLLGPQLHAGPESRIRVNFYVLGKDLHSGLQPLGEGGFEGVAVGPDNLIAWQRIPAGQSLRPGESWLQGSQRIKLEHYAGRIEYQQGKPQIVGKRRIMNPPPEGCSFMEVWRLRYVGRQA